MAMGEFLVLADEVFYETDPDLKAKGPDRIVGQYQLLEEFAQEEAQRGIKNKAYRIAIGGIALGALSSKAHQAEITRSLTQNGVLSKEDAEILEQLAGSLIFYYRLAERDPDRFTLQLEHQTKPIRDRIRTQPKKKTAALELAIHSLAWSATKHPPFRQKTADWMRSHLASQNTPLE